LNRQNGAAIKNLEMKSRLLAVAAVGEAVTGVVLVVYPPIVIRLFFRAEITGAGVVMSRICGIALIALGVACWPCAPASRALCGMLTYSALATLYLTYVGFAGEWVGVLLWPAVILHVILTALLARAWFQTRTPD